MVDTSTVMEPIDDDAHRMDNMIMLGESASVKSVDEVHPEDDDAEEIETEDADLSPVDELKPLTKITIRQAKKNVSDRNMRRARTIDVPMAARARFSVNSDASADEKLLYENTPPASAHLLRSMSYQPQRLAAVEAIENRDVRFKYSTAYSVRENVREMHSHRIREFPDECCLQAEDVLVQVGPVWRKMTAEIDREGFWCWRTSLVRKKTKEFRVVNDDILGATIGETGSDIVLHLMRPGRGKNDNKLKRRYKHIDIRFADQAIAEKWMQALQSLVKWFARVPADATRKIKVVVNPHSGRRQGMQIWQKWKPAFEHAGIQCDMEETKYGGHARDIGATFDMSLKYEAIVFVGGDGTVNEFMNGVFSREEDEWRQLVATTPVSLMCAGTDNAFGKGVGIPTHEAAVYCIIKRKIRPLDVVTCEGDRADGTKHREFACCGISYGVGGDIAMESEATRWLGVHRYLYLKIKRGVIAPRKHECTIRYVLSDTTDTDPDTGKQVLNTYYDIADRGAHDQHHIEMCSVYDSSDAEKKWEGDASSIFNPASEEKYAGRWISEHNQYATVGASNVYFETKYAHPSDGNMDLVFARKGGIKDSIEVAARYIAGDYLKAKLVGYYKIKALVIEQDVDDPINVDGEVFDGPGPFRIEIVPQLLCVLSEK